MNNPLVPLIPRGGFKEEGSTFVQMYRISRKKLTSSTGCGTENTRPIFNAEMLIYQSKAKLDEKTLFGKFTHLLDQEIDLLAIQQKSLDKALFLYIFMHEIRSSAVRASITIVHIRKFYKM